MAVSPVTEYVFVVDMPNSDPFLYILYFAIPDASVDAVHDNVAVVWVIAEDTIFVGTVGAVVSGAGKVVTSNTEDGYEVLFLTELSTE